MRSTTSSTCTTSGTSSRRTPCASSGGGPPPRGRVRRTDRPAPGFGGGTPRSSRLRGRRGRSARGRGPSGQLVLPLTFNWGVPPLPKGPDLLRLAIDLAGVGGVELPLEISATDSFGSVTDAPVRRLTIVARQQVSLARVLAGEELLCDTFDRALAVTRFFLDNARVGSRNRSARPRLVAGGIVLALASGGLFTGCASQDATPLANQACAHVKRALAAEHAMDSVSSHQAARLRSEALDQVRAALRSRPRRRAMTRPGNRSSPP